jgi:hypothetical protein
MNYVNFYELTQASFGFFLLNVAYLSTTNLQTIILSDSGLGDTGFYSLGTQYLSWGLGSIISPTLMNKIGVRYCLVLGGLSNTVLILSIILA